MTDITVILTGTTDLVGQACVARHALDSGWLAPNGFRYITTEDGSAYVVRYNKKSIRVWPQKEKYYGD